MSAASHRALPACGGGPAVTGREVQLYPLPPGEYDDMALVVNKLPTDYRYAVRMAIRAAYAAGYELGHYAGGMEARDDARAAREEHAARRT